MSGHVLTSQPGCAAGFPTVCAPENDTLDHLLSETLTVGQSWHVEGAGAAEDEVKQIFRNERRPDMKTKNYFAAVTICAQDNRGIGLVIAVASLLGHLQLFYLDRSRMA